MEAARSQDQLFQRLEGLYHALAVQDSVIVQNPDFKEEMRGALPFDTSKVYFYVDDEHGEEIVRSRIETAADDIIHMYHQHKNMCMLFSLAEQNARQQDKQKFAENIESLCQKVENYSLHFIANHHQRFGRNAFLEYPCFRDEHLSYRRQIKRQAVRGSTVENVVQLAVVKKTLDSFLSGVAYFNPEGTPEGIKTEMRQFRKFLSGLPLERGALWTEIYTGNPDDSYSKRIELTRMLLREHLGFEVEK